jgi:glycine betaine/proline transport system permease protein/glycine betaine/proline transport system substrate-binding protein
MGGFIDEYIMKFPSVLQFHAGDIMDDAVKAFSREHIAGLRMIRGAIISGVGGIRLILSYTPWILLVIIVALLAWRLTKKRFVGALYAVMLTFIGVCGMWGQMIDTLSIVIAGVVICIILGFPIGILLAVNARANKIIRPVLDTMQTMPSWVYLVPAVILFSVGTTPALIATVIYAVVPMVRMTSHGLLHVDSEMIEASYAFGATRIQTLFKIQIPQAIPTIMAGVNQTIMMAMSMVVTCALIGANGLGMEILIATNRVEMGKALFPGICIVILAIILDRLTQASVKTNEAPLDG